VAQFDFRSGLFWNPRSYSLPAGVVIAMWDAGAPILP